MTRFAFESIALAKSSLVRMADTARDISCDSGSLWITRDGDLRDTVLEPGQSFRRDGAAGTIVYALAASRMTVSHVLSAPNRDTARRTAPAHELVME